MTEKRVLLSISDLYVKFRVRGRILTAISGVDLDIYEDETIAIVGESGCGKSVLTKSFAGMLDSNGFIDRGSIFFNDPELTSVSVPYNENAKHAVQGFAAKLNEDSVLEKGAHLWQQLQSLEQEYEAACSISPEEEAAFAAKRKEYDYLRADAFNKLQVLDSRRDREEYLAAKKTVAEYDDKLYKHEKALQAARKAKQQSAKQDTAMQKEFADRKAELQAAYKNACTGEISDEVRARNLVLAKEMYMALQRYTSRNQLKLKGKLQKALTAALRQGKNLNDAAVRTAVFEEAVFYVKLTDEKDGMLRGETALNLAKNNCMDNWTTIRGNKIATVFQDPMTSLNPILTIGNQISSVIMKHQNVSETEAKKRAIILMKKVGIPEAEMRYDDYPFQYSGGMRQRIVIAIALSCQPKILICDEPTTALDVTIQAQILQLIKDLQKEFHFTTVFITHDLGVVANVADRVAVLYAGKIIEYGTAEEVFYDPRHPYTWVLLSSLPQLGERGKELYSITGTPPSLYSNIAGDAFAPRNPYCLRVDTLKEPPMFQVTETHYARTWLLDPRAPKIEKPEAIRNITGTLREVFHI